MEHQNPPPFPFDALEAPIDPGNDFGTGDLFPGSAPISAIAVGVAPHETLVLLRRKLQELDVHLRGIIAIIDQGAERSSEARDVDVRMTNVRMDEPSFAMPKPRPVDPLASSLQREDDSLRTIEGVFDGQNMIGPDGKRYSVPSNYASKSKLVEGDILKLRITQRGAFVYKQIGPIARDRRIGIIERDDITGEYVVIVPDTDDDRGAIVRAIVDRADLPTTAYKRYRTLRASVTYYHGEPGDEAVMLVPKDAPSTWAAVENIIKR